jgi:hypothetical protein
MMKFLTFSVLFFFGISTAAAQQIVDKKSYDSAIKTLQTQTAVPLKLPTYFIVPAYLTAKERKRPLKVILAEAKTDSFALGFCYSGICQGSFNYGEVLGEKLTPQTEKPAFDKTVKLARGITGYFQESSCGASCGNAWMFWEQDGYFYSLGLSVDDIATLTKVANSAINNNRLTAKLPVRAEISNLTNPLPQTDNFDSVEAFLKSMMKGEDKLEFQTKGDLNGDGLEDWAGIIERKKTVPLVEDGIEIFKTVRLYVLLRQRQGGFLIAEKSKETGVFGVGNVYLEDLEIRRGSLYLQVNAQAYASFSQFRLYQGAWRLVGWREVRVDVENDKLLETDRNLLTGAVVEKRQIGSRKPSFKRYRKNFSRYFLRDFNLFGIEIE